MTSILDHELVGVDAGGDLCSCHTKADSWLEHLGEIALTELGVPSRVLEPLYTRADVLRTRVVLAQLAGEQERLSAELNTTGLTDFADRADWLIAHRTPDEQLAWRRHWRRLGFSDPEPRRERFPRSSSLAVPVAPKRRRKPVPVIPVDRQLEIALQVLADQEAA